MEMNNSKGSIELEGLKVPDIDVIKMVVDKYKEELGKDALDSLLYAINEGVNMIKKENENEKTR